jgi:hypothetical protein
LIPTPLIADANHHAQPGSESQTPATWRAIHRANVARTYDTCRIVPLYRGVVPSGLRGHLV